MARRFAPAFKALGLCEQIWLFSLQDNWATLLSPKWAEILLPKWLVTKRPCRIDDCVPFALN